MEVSKEAALRLVIPGGQQVRPIALSSEADVSSAFAVAALAAVAKLCAHRELSAAESSARCAVCEAA